VCHIVLDIATTMPPKRKRNVVKAFPDPALDPALEDNSDDEQMLTIEPPREQAASARGSRGRGRGKAGTRSHEAPQQKRQRASEFMIFYFNI
jgi:hypothetical protein